MKQKIIKIIGLASFILLIIIGLYYFIFQLKSNASGNSVTNNPVFNLSVNKVLESDLKLRLKTFNIKEINFASNESSNIKISLSKNDLPKDWSITEIYTKKLNLSPEGLAKFFQGPLPDTGLDIYLASNPKINPNDLTRYLKESYEKNPPESWSMIAVGDIMLSRHVDQKMAQNGYSYPFEKIKDYLKNADLTIANLESPFKEGLSPREGMVFGANKKAIEGLKLAEFDLINLANNHFGNQGENGAELTFNWLKENGFSYIGAGKTDSEAHTPVIKEIKGQKIAFLGYTDTDVIPTSYIALDSRAGVAAMDINRLKEDIFKVKEKVDLVIISMHSGTEYTPSPNERQKEFAHAAIEAGADMVTGHHPHVVQAIEFYNNKFIFYSLGNFIFDQMWSTETRQGIILKLSFTFGRLTDTEILPIKIDDFSQPHFLEEKEEQETILKRIFEASEKLR